MGAVIMVICGVAFVGVSDREVPLLQDPRRPERPEEILELDEERI